MFERRLKILLGLIFSFSLILVLRAGWLQVVQGSDYARRATDAGRKFTPIETLRGDLIDYRGRKIALDAPCIDACVDYRALNPETKEAQDWLRDC